MAKYLLNDLADRLRAEAELSPMSAALYRLAADEIDHQGQEYVELMNERDQLKARIAELESDKEQLTAEIDDPTPYGVD
jgi:cell division protein FtsB